MSCLWRHSDFDIKKSEQLAELGYFAFAMDLYGQGRRGSNPPRVNGVDE